MKKLGVLEAGGTKMVYGIYDEAGNELERIYLPTTTPEETLPPIADYFAAHQVDALGIASFGPLNLIPDSPNYGYITSTPKPGWQDTPLLEILLRGRNIPVGFDTDVNAAALAEAKYYAPSGICSLVYVTVGTGIGGGVVVDGKPIHGMLHPELGHIPLRPHPLDPLPEGICSFHKSCLEGLAGGKILDARSPGASAKNLKDDDPVFEIEAYYLAQLCANLILIVSPEKIILGGGVLNRSFLLPMIRQETVRLLNRYIRVPQLEEQADQYIVTPHYFPVSGLVGAYELAMQALREA